MNAAKVVFFVPENRWDWRNNFQPSVYILSFDGQNFNLKKKQEPGVVFVKQSVSTTDFLDGILRFCNNQTHFACFVPNKPVKTRASRFCNFAIFWCRASHFGREWERVVGRMQWKTGTQTTCSQHDAHRLWWPFTFWGADVFDVFLKLFFELSGEMWKLWEHVKGKTINSNFFHKTLQIHCWSLNWKVNRYRHSWFLAPKCGSSAFMLIDDLSCKTFWSSWDGICCVQGSRSWF